MKEDGFTLVELIVAMALTLILAGTAALNLRELNNPADSASRVLFGYMKSVRAKAMATTFAYTISPISSTKLKATYAPACSDADQKEDPETFLELPHGAFLLDTAWSVCYKSRGISDSSVDIQVQDERLTRTVRVTLGGGVKVE